MKIENIIEDIIDDMLEISCQTEESIKKQYPFYCISIFLPGLEQLTTIKIMQLLVKAKGETWVYCVEVHTHNGNRVFEKLNKEAGDICEKDTHHVYIFFVATLREIIKKRKFQSALQLRNRHSKKQL